MTRPRLPSATGMLKLARAATRGHRALPTRPRFRARHVCIGCGCTDDQACHGGCSWTQPGICSRCADRTDDLLRGSTIATDIFVRTWVTFRSLGASGFTISSLIIIGFLRDNEIADRHRRHLAEGLPLKPFTRVRIRRRSWSFELVYEAPTRRTAMTYVYRIAFTSGGAARAR